MSAAALESVRHGQAQVDTGPAPESFDERYTLPVHRTKLLERLHPHPRDSSIVFYEKPHVYTINGQCASGSVSGLIKPYTEDFDADRVIEKMKRNATQAWPRYQYALNTRPLETDALGELRTQEPLQPVLLVADAEASKTLYAGPVSRCPTPVGTQRLHLFDRAMSNQEIKSRWDSPEARNRGTEAHYQMELWMNSEPARVADLEVTVGLEFVRTQLAPHGIRAYRTEWEIFADNESIAGSLDFVGALPDGILVIVDWKRSPKLRNNLHDAYRKSMKWPFSHLDDCDGCKYAIQLSAYAWILETYYGKRVAALALCSLHPEAPFHTWVPYMRLEIDVLMRERREMVARLLTLEFMQDEVEPPVPLCTLTGRIAFEAVRDAGGKICNEKDLRVLDEEAEFTPCPEERRRCRASLEQVRVLSPNTELERMIARAVTWKKRMPKQGVAGFEEGRRLMACPGEPDKCAAAPTDAHMRQFFGRK